MSNERQVRTLMRAWPRPDRIERGDEIVGTTLDLLREGITHLPVHLAVNLVLGGLQARWRMRPPLWRWAWYRMGGRLPTRWHRWMLNDLTSPGWRRRMVMSRAIAVGFGAIIGVSATQIVLHQTDGFTPTIFLVSGMLIGGLLGAITRSRKDRDRQLVRNGYHWPPSNDPPWPPPPAPTTSDQQRPGAIGRRPT